MLAAGLSLLVLRRLERRLFLLLTGHWHSFDDERMLQWSGPNRGGTLPLMG
jgi:hypothetical protein